MASFFDKSQGIVAWLTKATRQSNLVIKSLAVCTKDFVVLPLLSNERDPL
jgi:hypothetical protein